MDILNVGQLRVDIHRFVVGRLQGGCHLLAALLLISVVVSALAHVGTGHLLGGNEGFARLCLVVSRLGYVVMRCVMHVAVAGLLSHLDAVVHVHTCRSQELAEPLTVPSDTLGWFSEWQSVPIDVLSSKAVQVDNALLTAGAVDWTHVFLSEHRVILDRSALVRLQIFQQLVQLFQGFLKLSELLSCAFLVGEHVFQVCHQFI